MKVHIVGNQAASVTSQKAAVSVSGKAHQTLVSECRLLVKMTASLHTFKLQREPQRADNKRTLMMGDVLRKAHAGALVNRSKSKQNTRYIDIMSPLAVILCRAPLERARATPRSPEAAQ